jgi:hydroxyacylglutathione hydrolase
MAIGRVLAWIAVSFAILAVGAALGAPYIDAELSPWLEPHAIVDPLGSQRALLFDSGTATRDIRPVIAALTQLPVTVIASHLHFDHLAGIAAFPSVAMIDLPETRADVADGVFTPRRYQYLGMVDHLHPPSVRVTEWITPDGVIELGGRQLTLLHTPGHTSNSVSLFDAAHRQFFAGDFIYPTTLYAFLPGASLSAYRATTRRLLSMLPADTRLWTAHCCRAQEKTSAPWLEVQDLRDLDRALADIQSGRVRSTGFYPRRFPVNDQMTIATGFAWNNQ